jgi:hypothetical protein
MNIQIWLVNPKEEITPYSHKTENVMLKSTANPGYNDIGLYDTSSTASDILW